MDERLQKLFDQIYNDKSEKDPDQLIIIVEPFGDFLNSDFSANQDDYIKSTRILSIYALALSKVGYLRKPLPYFNKSINNIKNDPDITPNIRVKDLVNEPLYKTLIFHRGMANYNLKKYVIPYLILNYL